MHCVLLCFAKGGLIKAWRLQERVKRVERSGSESKMLKLTRGKKERSEG